MKQNSKDVDPHGPLSSMTSDRDGDSQKSEQSLKSVKSLQLDSEIRTRALYRDKETINFGGPNGKILSVIGLTSQS